jgi:hypothetical protein
MVRMRSAIRRVSPLLMLYRPTLQPLLADTAVVTIPVLPSAPQKATNRLIQTQ